MVAARSRSHRKNAPRKCHGKIVIHVVCNMLGGVQVIVPRFVNKEAPFTSIYRLPDQRLQQYTMGKIERWKRYEIAVLEIDGSNKLLKATYTAISLNANVPGNPFPPVLGEKPDKSSSLLNVLLRDSLQNRLKKLQTKSQDGS